MMERIRNAVASISPEEIQRSVNSFGGWVELSIPNDGKKFEHLGAPKGGVERDRPPFYFKRIDCLRAAPQESRRVLPELITLYTFS
ncbi:hypothetical protein J6590_007267 [Homalodisca vitripennis]|nr:hypothetical protein J6590_007267 [Homalodisca vitripennis]